MSVIFERDRLTIDEQIVNGTPVLWIAKQGNDYISALNRDDVLDLYGTLHRWLKDTDPRPRRKLLGPRGI